MLGLLFGSVQSIVTVRMCSGFLKFLHSPPAGWGAEEELFRHLPVSKKGFKETQVSMGLSPPQKTLLLK